MHLKRIVATVLGALSAVIVALSANGCSSHTPLVSAKLAQAERAIRSAEQAGVDRELTAVRAGTDARGFESDQVRLATEARVREAEAQARAAEQAKGAALAKELASLRAQQTDRGLVLTIGDVLFDAGKTSVGPGAQRSIDKLAEFLKTYPKRNVLIEGHSDSLGNEEFNLKLSQQRADAVRDLLVARGITSQRIRTKGYGAKFPIVDNDTSVGRQQNRRVEVLVLT